MDTCTVLRDRWDKSVPTDGDAGIGSASFFYEFPGAGHDVIHSHGCALQIGLQFLDDPTIEPDAACLDGLTGSDFK